MTILAHRANPEKFLGSFIDNIRGASAWERCKAGRFQALVKATWTLSLGDTRKTIKHAAVSLGPPTNTLKLEAFADDVQWVAASLGNHTSKGTTIAMMVPR